MNKTIHYITYQTFPADTANSIQSISNIKYLVRKGVKVKLFFPKREQQSNDDMAVLKKHYDFIEEFHSEALEHKLPFGNSKYFNKLAYLYSHLVWSRRAVNIVLKKYPKPDVFFTRSDWVYFFLSLKNQHVVFECHQLTYLRKLLVNISIKRDKSKLICLTHAIANDLKIPKFYSNKITIIPNGYDEDYFDNEYSKEKKLGNKNRVVFVGNLKRFGKSRGLNNIIDIYESEDIKESFELTIVGGPNNVAEELKNNIEKRKLQNVISVVGQQNRREALNIIENSDIGVLINDKGNKHSELYTSPLKYFEYLRGKLKIVAVDFPSHRSLVFSDKIFFFDLDSRESLISAMKLSSKDDTPLLKEEEIRELSLEARATKVSNLCFLQ
jgi:glycosyltransferase involved in cell wall biosynthesis